MPEAGSDGLRFTWGDVTASQTSDPSARSTVSFESLPADFTQNLWSSSQLSHQRHIASQTHVNMADPKTEANVSHISGDRTRDLDKTTKAVRSAQ